MVNTNERFWDCECKDNHIHPKDEPTCSMCGKHQDEMPDSHTVEVDKFLADSVFARMDISPKDMSLHMSRHSTVRSTLDMRQATFSRGIDIYSNGILLGELNIRLTPDGKGLEFDLTRGYKDQEVKILAWAQGKLIANKALPSNSVTIHMKPSMGEGR